MNQLLGITKKTVQNVTLQMRACEELEKCFFKDRIISQNLLATQISRSNACRLLSLEGLLKGKVYKNTPRTIEQLQDAIRQEIQAVNVDTLGKVQGVSKRMTRIQIIKYNNENVLQLQNKLQTIK